MKKSNSKTYMLKTAFLIVILCITAQIRAGSKVDQGKGSVPKSTDFVAVATALGDSNQATAPEPANGADKYMNLPLSWTKGAGTDIAYHDVYVSATEADVTNRTAPNTVLVVSTTEYNPTVTPGNTYYWAVDELDASYNVVAGGTGEVWNFEALDIALVDGFDRYDTSSNFIYNTWIDGWVPAGNHPTGALIDLATHATDPIIGSGQGLKLMYDNDGLWSHDFPYTPAPYYSEVRAEVADLEMDDPNWVQQNLATFHLFFAGETTNDANEQLYVKLKDGSLNSAKVVYDGDADDVNDGNWHIWRIDLNDFTGVDVTNVNAVIIGIGNGVDPAPNSGQGILYFDILSLYTPDPVELLFDLRDQIIKLEFPKGTTKSLLAKLDTALKLLEDENENNDVAAINVLEAFINAVEAQYDKKIPTVDADVLISTAEQIIELLSTE
ncbi:MAG: hypothetical protein ACYSSI_06210 [Planctomycetota bacterium]